MKRGGHLQGMKPEGSSCPDHTRVPKASVRTMALPLGELKAIGGSGAEHHSVCFAENPLWVDKKQMQGAQ